MMSRARSKTVDTAEVKKSGLPRRLNEKIALMKKNEQAQSQAFEQAMQSIFEMQQARLHGGGGSMPSLQNIDSPPSNQLPLSPTMYSAVPIDTSGCLTTPPVAYNRERPLSGGSSGRNLSVERTLSYESSGQQIRVPPPHHHHHHHHHLAATTNSNAWNVHKSESDLPQSLVDHMATLENPSFFQFQTPPSIVTPTSPHNGYHHTPHSSGQVAVSSEKEAWRNNMFCGNARGGTFPIQSSVATNGSISTVLLSPDHGGGAMTSNIDPTHIGSASSLPDLTNIEFSSGLDVPLEKDDDSPTYNKVNPFHFPSPGPSKLALSSMAAPSITSPPTHGSFVNPEVFVTPGVQPHPHPHFLSHSSGRVPRSPTFSDFRTHTQLSAPPFRKFKHGGSTVHHGYQTLPTSFNEPTGLLSMLSPSAQGLDGLVQQTTGNFNSGMPYSSASLPNEGHTPPLFTNEMASPTSAFQSFPNSTHTAYPTHLPSLHIDNSLILGGLDSNHTHHPHTHQPQPNSPAKPPSLASTSSSGYVSLPPYLDPASISYQQRALQQRLAGISVFKDNPPLRSHSEENLMKMQKDIMKGDSIIQQNPFMGNMSNASSVPCVYVETNAVEPCVDELDSYTTGTGSPSTSASHASSPPMLRPDWIEHPQVINEFVFQDWPLESGAMSDKTKFGSPLSHHKSLTELNKIGEYVNMELSPNASSRAHQLSLPSIVMGDLIALDEQNLEKQGSGPFLPDDFDMEEEVMESLLRDDNFVPFGVNMMGTDPVILDSSEYYHHGNNSMKF